MWVQLFLMILALLVCLVQETQGNSRDNRHRYVTFLIILLVLQSALRHLTVGVDTYSYSIEWEVHGNEPWSMIWQRFYDVYVLGEGKDAGYMLLLKLLYYIIPSFRIFLFVFAICFFIPLFRLVEKHLFSLRQIYLSFCLYQVLFYSFFSITGMRQGIATIATFYCFYLIQENKFFKFMIILCVASFIHKSVLLFLPFYFIAKIPQSKYFLIAVLVAFPILFGLGRQFALFMVDFSGAEQYRAYAESEMETGGAVNFMVLMLTIAILTWNAKRRNIDSIPDSIVNAMALAVIFTPMMWVDMSLMRVIQYFSIFSLIALPLAIDNFSANRSLNSMLYWSLWIVFIAVTIRHNYEYAFLWDTVNTPITH